MKKLNNHLLFLLAITFLFVGLSCNGEGGGSESCEEKIAHIWNSTYVESSGTNITDFIAIKLVLDDDGDGRVTVTDLSSGGGTTSADLSDWEVDTDCENFEFTDENGGDADMKIVRLDDTELKLDGIFYGFQYEIEFERN